jgi:hypothetical protein
MFGYKQARMIPSCSVIVRVNIELEGPVVLPAGELSSEVLPVG